MQLSILSALGLSETCDIWVNFTAGVRAIYMNSLYLNIGEQRVGRGLLGTLNMDWILEDILHISFGKFRLISLFMGEETPIFFFF